MGVPYAIIGGTGVYDPQILSNIREEVIPTRYGEITVKIGTYAGNEVAFLPRHGEKHSVPPHLINYRANIWGLKELGVKKIIATAAVGSLNEQMRPGDFVLVDQFLDFTHGRIQTFFEGGEHGVVHVDLTFPYCQELREVLAQAAQEIGLTAHFGGTYICTQGPRFETAGEIRMFQKLGGDLVGMTTVPEVVLAREAGICYATVAMVTNFAAGISPTRLTHQEVLDVMKQNGENLRRLIMQAVAKLTEERYCDCGQILEEVKP
ncbi:MAG: S-methyl-5'-thioadenosine phosphorylase [Firmicutes bacterium]|nr:S-methyl-5'-thioadenosine phosphorylase [Bacillota bacterium]